MADRLDDVEALIEQRLTVVLVVRVVLLDLLVVCIGLDVLVVSDVDVVVAVLCPA